MHPATVLLDPSLLHSFVQQLTDWALALAQDQLDIRLDCTTGRPRPVFSSPPATPAPEAPASSDQLLAWSLIEQMARAHLRLERLDRPDATQP
jgi:type VI protein secretion system component VasA